MATEYCQHLASIAAEAEEDGLAADKRKKWALLQELQRQMETARAVSHLSLLPLNLSTKFTPLGQG